MLPIIALVGRPNVGKSTLFNVLTGTRDAIVADVPGVTRDRQYGFGKVGPIPYVAIDTGGLVENPTGIETQMRVQTERAIEEADRFIFIADARAGLTHQDQFVARELRRAGKPVFLAVNKAESLDTSVVSADFHALALGEPICISATHGQGTEELMELVLQGLEPSEPEDARDSSAIRIAVIGRPNVGKSTLVNRLLGEERVIASEQPGTTRDSIFVPFRRDDRDFLLIDTAGVRRRSKVEDVIERVSVAKTLQAIDDAHVVIHVVDAHEQVGEQDASVLGLALKRGRAVIIAVNKWDHIPPEQRDEIRRQVELKLDFVPYAPVHFISARHGTGVGDLVGDMIHAYESAMRVMRTQDLTRAMESAMVAHQPPLVHGRRIKLRYAHQGGKNPPRIVIHGNQTEHVPDAYSRYLSNMFRKTFDLFATPVSVEFRSERNPFTERLREKRQSSSRPGKATANNPGSKNQRASNEVVRKKRKKAKRERDKTTGGASRARKKTR
ncbi:MAG: ribosome biogenesis GTPase Der [Gammaproteobacteria bacterium]